jgi:hypothetical protein
MCHDNNTWYFVVQLFHTLDFFTHFHAYCISGMHTVEYKILAISELLDCHPLYCHACQGSEGAKKLYVRLPYHVFKV